METTHKNYKLGTVASEDGQSKAIVQQVLARKMQNYQLFT